jgi:TRAP transporter TAXI family solute receptor
MSGLFRARRTGHNIPKVGDDMRRTAIAAATLVLLAGGLTACGGRQDAASTDAGGDVTCEVIDETRVGIATGNSIGVYYALGTAYANEVGIVGGKLRATASETGASVQNIQQVVGGTYNLAFSLADTAADAINGTGSFTSRQPIAALARIHTNYTQVIVRKAAGIKDVAGMRGKRVSTGSPKSGTEVIANRVLTAAGLDPAKDISAQKLDLTKTVDGIKDGSIDAFFWSGGLPTPGVTDLLTTAGDKVDFLDIPTSCS